MGEKGNTVSGAGAGGPPKIPVSYPAPQYGAGPPGQPMPHDHLPKGYGDPPGQPLPKLGDDASPKGYGEPAGQPLGKTGAPSSFPAPPQQPGNAWTSGPDPTGGPPTGADGGPWTAPS